MPTLISIVMWSLLSACLGQNIETRIHRTLNPQGGDGVEFGRSLAAHDRNIYAGAPRLDNQGGMFRCNVEYTLYSNDTERCRSIDFGGDGNRMTGTVMEKLPGRNYLLACGNQYEISCPNRTIQQRMIGKCFTYSFNDAFVTSLPSLCPIACPRGLIVDIVFVIDESGSVQPGPFRLGLEWVTTVLRGFSYDIDEGNVQVGYVVFDNSISINVAPANKNYYQLKSDIEAIPYDGGSTNTALAIRTADTLLTSGSRSVPKILIVITDGRSNNNGQTISAANTAKGKDIVIISVGVGSGVLQSELEDMASPPVSTNVMNADDYAKLDSILDKLTQVITETASTSLEGGSSNSTTELTNCQFGTSAHASANGLYIGAVGSYDRTGTVAQYDDLSLLPTPIPSGHLNSTDLERIIGSQTPNALKDSYFGYSVTSGSFTDGSTEWVAMSAPRYLSRGTVLIYHDPSNRYYVLHPSDASGYWQLGAYYGHDILALDVNDDNLDDLVVSAPLYSKTAGYDEGLVFVYMNNASNTGAQNWAQSTFLPSILEGGSVPGARFGLSIASAGDIDKNGYQDIIIGAPAEGLSDSGSGAIYIYFSSSTGFNDANKQRISGKSVSSGSEVFRWFGAATQGGSDFDLNGYTDVAVSAPSSDRVILLRTRRLIAVTLTTSVSPTFIDLLSCGTNQTVACSTVTVCISAHFVDGATFDSFGMTFNVTLDSLIGDPAFKRFYFVGTTLSIASKTLKVGSSSICSIYEMQIRTESMGALNGGGLETTPEVELSVDFSQTHKDAVMSGVMSSNSEKLEKAAWTIEKGCSGDDDQCRHNLGIVATFSEAVSSSPIVLDGSSKTLILNATIRNDGPDYAFFLKVNISSGNLTVIRTSGGCVEESTESDSTVGLTVIKYRSSRNVFRDRMLSDETCDFSIEFDFTRLQTIASEPMLRIMGSVYSNAGGDSVAFDPDRSNNFIRFERPLQYKANLLLDGSSLPEKLFLNKTTDNAQIVLTSLDSDQLGGSSTDLVHSYSIYNSGPLGLANARVKLTWPEKTTNGHFLLYLIEVRCKPETACTCQTQGKVNPLNIAPKASSFGSYLVEYTTKNISEADAFAPSEPVTCDNSQCNEIFCSLNFVSTFSTVDVSVVFKPWTPSFSKDFSSVQVSSTLELLLATTTVNYNAVEEKVVTTLSTINPDEPPPEPTTGELNIGAIIGGILGGILLLVAIVAGMWKAGFFKSKYGKMTREARKSIREAGPRGDEDMEEGPGTSNPEFNKSTEDLCDE